MTYVSELGKSLREVDVMVRLEETIEKGYKFALSSGGVRVSAPGGQMADFRLRECKTFKGALTAALDWCDR